MEYLFVIANREKRKNSTDGIFRYLVSFSTERYSFTTHNLSLPPLSLSLFMYTYIHKAAVNRDYSSKTNEPCLLFCKPNGINWSYIRDAVFFFFAEEIPGALSSTISGQGSTKRIE